MIESTFILAFLVSSGIIGVAGVVFGVANLIQIYQTKGESHASQKSK